MVTVRDSFHKYLAVYYKASASDFMQTEGTWNLHMTVTDDNLHNIEDICPFLNCIVTDSTDAHCFFVYFSLWIAVWLIQQKNNFFLALFFIGLWYWFSRWTLSFCPILFLDLWYWLSRRTLSFCPIFFFFLGLWYWFCRWTLSFCPISLLGLCGSYDDDESNDFLTAEGNLVRHRNDFILSWR